MIDKSLDHITHADIVSLVQAGWPEGKTIEYKRDSYGSSDADKKELLKDVSSFANTQGGDIFIGIEEDRGVPIGCPGITIEDSDAEKLRLEEIIRNGLEPRIDFAIHAIPTPDSTTIFIVRIKESLIFPHRVVFRGKFGEFWARSSAGKFSMDTDELRRAFTLSDSVYDQIRRFRQDRVMQVLRDDTPVPLLQGAKLILHLIPLASFRSRERFDVVSMPELSTKFPPITATGWDGRFNLNGYVCFAGKNNDGNGFRSYTQFFRTGIVEAVLADVVSENAAQGKRLLAGYYESCLTERFRTMDQYTKAFRELGIDPPIWCFLSFVGVKGAVIPSSGRFPDERRDIDRDVLLIPEGEIDDLQLSSVSILRPLFDLVWNASGYPRSFNFDNEGNWIGG